MSIIRFMPSYVGSKRLWVERLRGDLQGRPIAELFCGSGVLSANLASSALLVDMDPMVHKILARFDEQVVPDVFTRDDYYRLRGADDWWRHAYCLQSISFSGVFRYSDKSGYNVPAKGGPDPSKNKVNEWSIRPSYEEALERWSALKPVVELGSYIDFDADRIESILGPDAVVVLDPPYEGSRASYNGNGFDYDAYWERVWELSDRFTTVVFDRASNLLNNGFEVHDTRKMRVNGARPGDEEGVAIHVHPSDNHFTFQSRNAA
jgi:site-specific DNA-adenine methylase